MTTPINIIIDNKTVLDDVELCEIKQVEGQYCSSVSLSMKSKTFWTLCDPTTNFGTLRIKVVIGGTTYQFLTEERDTTPTKSGVAFTVWGRSKQALLSKPYSKTINDTDDTSHPWQSGNSTAKAIVAYVIANYCDYSVTVTWNAGEFAVYADTFSVSNQSPVDVIAALANVIGAELVAVADGSLTIEAYSVAEGTSVESYDDLDDIVQLSESIDYPSGFNAVTVYGYGSGGSGSINATISTERQSTGSIYPGRGHTVRVYYYHAQGDTPTFSFPEGSCQLTGSGVESITEDVRLIFGKGNTTYSNTEGETAVTGDTSIPITTVSTTYNANYQDYSVRGGSVNTYNVMFYFEDKSAYTIYSFSVVAAPGSDDSGDNTCSDIVIEKYSPDIVTPDTDVLVRVYNPSKYEVLETLSSYHFTPHPVGGFAYDIITEEVTFTNGVASLAYPVYQPPGSTSGIQSVSWKGPIRSTIRPIYKNGSKTLNVEEFVDDFDHYYAMADISYYTLYKTYGVNVPASYTLSTIQVAFRFATCGVKGISISVSGTDDSALRRDITLNVKDWATEVDVSGVTVYVDGTWKGSTDGDGNISLSNITVGDHTLRLTKSGYLNSDLDDLANDSFTVSSA